MNLTGKVALVTGAAQGIGEAVVRILGEYGVQVVAVDKNITVLDKLVFDLTAKGIFIKAFVADVRDSACVEDVVNQIENEMGPIEILVNVAGILRMSPIDSLSDEEWNEVFSVNSNGVFYVSRSVSRRMMSRKSGSIVTVGSNAASVPRMHMSAYAASKAAATMFTKCLGLEMAKYNVRCNLVSPGSTDTEMQRQLWTDENGVKKMIAGSQDTYRLGIPLNKIATPSEIAEVVLFLVSDKASHITMHNLCIDGGATLGV